MSCNAEKTIRKDEYSLSDIMREGNVWPRWRTRGRRPSTHSCHSSIIASFRDEDRTCAYERCTRATLHVRMYDAFDYGRYTTLTTSRKVLRLVSALGRHASARRRWKAKYFNPGWLIHDITNTLSIHLEILRQSIFHLHDHQISSFQLYFYTYFFFRVFLKSPFSLIYE